MIPKKSRAEIEKIISSFGEKLPCIVGVRGYYKQTLGNPQTNDRGIYDDAFFVVGENTFEAFQGNVDPAENRRGIATLKCGNYDCVKWKHKGKYDALQIVRDVVTRDGQVGEDVGRHGINFHFGSENQTWSEGCQTVRVSDWRRFINTVYRLIDGNNLNTIKYILIDGE